VIAYRIPCVFSIKVILLLLFFQCGITGCNDSSEEKNTSNEQHQQNDQADQRAVFHVPLLNNPTTLDPLYVNDEYGASVVHQIFDGLVEFDSYLMILPNLAESWQMGDDGKEYRFVIRENARFHNGNAVTVEDVLFSISRLIRADPSPVILPHLLKIDGAQDYRDEKIDRLEGFEKISRQVFKITLTEPHAPFITALGMVYAKIVPKAEVLRQGDEFGQNPVGSGPFEFISWELDNEIRLKRYSEYFGGAALLNEIQYKIYPGVEIDQILSDFRDGKLEEMPTYGTFKQELSSEKDLKWFTRPSLSLLFYGIRCNHPLLNIPEFRAALSKAIDREKLVREIYNGQFQAAKTILPPGMPRINGETATVVDDIESSQKYLESILGVRLDEIPPLEIVSASQSTFAQSELNFIRNAWAKLGITVNIKYIVDWSEFESYIKSDAVQIYRYAWFADMPDPDSFLYPLFASQSPINFMRFENKVVDQMLLSARGERDSAKRTAIYRQIEAMILKSAPLIPLFNLNVNRVYQANVQGAYPSALGAHTMPLHRVSLKKEQ